MITLFRRFRQKLIGSGSVAKYLLYAVGEILLVVIGILIALQVNNWNEERLRQADEREVLLNVKTDFQSAKAELEYLNGLREDMVRVVNEMVKDEPYPDERFSEVELDSMFAILGYAPTYNNQSGSLNVLLNSRRINLVTDDSLRAMLLDWPGLVADMVEGEVDQKEFQTGFYAPKMMEYLSFNDIVSNLAIDSFGGEPFENFRRETRKSADYRGFFRDPDVENILVRREFFLLGAIAESRNLINNAYNIIERIDQHVGSGK